MKLLNVTQLHMLGVLCYQVRILMVKQKIILSVNSDFEAKLMMSGNLTEDILTPEGTCRTIFSVSQSAGKQRPCH